MKDLLLFLLFQGKGIFLRPVNNYIVFKKDYFSRQTGFTSC